VGAEARWGTREHGLSCSATIWGGPRPGQGTASHDRNRHVSAGSVTTEGDPGQTEHSLYTLLQMLSVTLLEKVDSSQALTNIACTHSSDALGNQLVLFNF
jgi:hypothetical protein